MHYEINIGKKDKKPGWNGKPSYTHFFATHERSIPSELKLRRVLTVFKEAFPEPEYNISARKVTTIQEGMSIKKVLGTDKPKIYEYELGKGYYLFGGRGDVECDTVHIMSAGTTLCGVAGLSSNHAKISGVDYAGCPECIQLYKNETKTNKNE